VTPFSSGARVGLLIRLLIEDDARIAQVVGIERPDVAPAGLFDNGRALCIEGVDKRQRIGKPKRRQVLISQVALDSGDESPQAVGVPNELAERDANARPSE